MSANPSLTVEDGPVTLLRLERPDVHNALNSDLLGELDTAVARTAASGTARAIVITGSGDRAFSAGADLGELTGLDASEAHARLTRGQQVLNRIATCPLPVIAAVNGTALGGGFELVLAATFPVLAQNAKLGLPEAGLGLIPGYGGTQRLVRSVGPQVATHAMLTGTRLTADRAYELGLTPVPPVAADEVVTTALETARDLTTRGPAAIQSILSAVRSSADAPTETGLRLESALAALATGSPEAAEGIAAFREKRTPVFGDAAQPREET
ncbi:enoyl-CoA hydratase [Lipingzhangella halophila]|uniref:enoyl-CoA hydratase n=1 Tax=Lipingzhangella halophila TaxID=1783352 RepID=A0A7W7W6U1_9ACTN|nr:enoyl-CoA hydratase-related protein [Lipingzhangella halophila]MBB4935294.1 enoyl-CoA hydratase [Lipingzhangella halophila]